MAEENILELIQKLQKAFEKRAFSERKEEPKSLNCIELNEAYHNKSLESLGDIQQFLKKIIDNLNDIDTHFEIAHEIRQNSDAHIKNLQVHLSNIDINIQASNAKFDKLLEIIECTSAYKEFEKAKELQKEAESNAREAEKCRQAALTIRIDDHKLFPLRKKAYMCLLRHNIKYIGDLLKYTEKGLWRLEGMGPIGIKEIKEQLAQHNFRLMTQ